MTLRSNLSRAVFLATAALAAACGPGASSGPDAKPGQGPDAAPGTPDAGGNTPILTPGGGVAGGPLSGVLNVYVVQPGGSTPITGAMVRVGDATAASPLTGATDGSGLITFTNASLTGKQMVTVTASGRTATTWIGVAGASVTIPLDPSPRAIPTARASGTIAGWDQLPSPATAHYTLAVVLSSFSADVSSPENNLTQPTDSSGTPLDTCLDTGNGSTCAWQLTTRTGQQVHTAVILDGDSKFTTSTADDTFTLIGYAVGPSMTLTAGQNATGETLTMVPAGSLTNLSVSFPAAPSGLPYANTIPMLDRGADGKIVFPLPLVNSGNTTAKVIAPTGAYAGHYDLVSLATKNASTPSPFSTTIQRNISLGGATIDAWLPAPTGVSATGGTYKFTAPGGATPLYAVFSRGGTYLWDVTILDGSSSFQLPTLSPDPLGSGSTTFQVTVADVTGFNPASFAVPDMPTKLHRASGAQVTFTH